MSDKSGFRFEKLDVWQKSMEWVDKIYHVTANFPADEKFGLISQLKRSSLSVASNIAEGSGRSSAKDFARFIEIAYGSLMEAICQCTIAKRQGFLSADDFQYIYIKTEEIAKMLSGLRAYLHKTKKRETTR